MRPTVPTIDHEAFRADLLAMLDRHAGRLPAEHMLAVAAHAVGQLVALQDQRRFTPVAAMEIVARNIEAGNRSAVDALINAPGGHA